MIIPFIQGFGLSAGLIIAIGAQNAFVLAQGVRREHYLIVPLVCAICDAALIALGVAGVGTVAASSPILSLAAALGGAVFLFLYGCRALLSAVRGGRLEAENNGGYSLRAVVLATLAITLLNPHVYLDTVVLLGGLSSQWDGPGRMIFGFGAMLASFIWFFLLSLGGRMLAPLFKRPLAWRILDGLVCLTMWTIAASLIYQSLT